ncbi:monocarboxylate transporter 12-like isoform X2 [Ruditapes philippinarum]|nr:monocarboxylate transporter 12-like isoform X2 [Ruditapes philippinarum]XP_060580892.1 monocarboxylate transporter 12-like isoform X2 [Ruditapes philippinarum]XP_060580893.1 monocarboxylate transporter 12-like isoform X2 [Ruditapes philippinarum]
MSDLTVDGARRKSRKYTHDVDSGYAWIILAGCFVMYVFVVGSLKAYGVLYTEMVEYYSSGSGNTAWIGSIALILLFGLGPLSNLLCKIYSFRRITFIGGIFLALGYCLSGFVTRMEMMYLTFLSTGIGYGLVFAPSSTIISFYFEKRRALANGITVSGSGLGAVALPFLYKFLIEQYGIQGMFWISGAIFANICVAACIFRQPSEFSIETSERPHPLRTSNTRNDCDSEENQMSIDSDVNRTAKKLEKIRCKDLDLKFSLFRRPLFTLYVLSFMCCAFGFAASIVLIPANVKALGYDDTHVALSVTILGSVEVVARILMGWVADLNIIQRKYMYAGSMFIGGIASVLAPCFGHFNFMAVYAAIVATFPGSYMSLVSVLLIEVVGLENFSPAFGLLSLSLAVANIPSHPAVGWLYDIYGNWGPSFLLTGCVYISAGVIIMLEPIVVRVFNIKTDNKNSNLQDNQQMNQDQYM